MQKSDTAPIRTKRTGVHLAFALMLGLTGTLTTSVAVASAQPAPTGSVISHEFSGSVHNLGSVDLHELDCPALGQGYVDGSPDSGVFARTTPTVFVIHIDRTVGYDVYPLDTAPLAFASRVVTKVRLRVYGSGSYDLNLSCTSDAEQGWRVFGSSPLGRLKNHFSVKPS